jgi:hypothetical protein
MFARMGKIECTRTRSNLNLHPPPPGVDCQLSAARISVTTRAMFFCRCKSEQSFPGHEFKYREDDIGPAPLRVSSVDTKTRMWLLLQIYRRFFPSLSSVDLHHLRLSPPLSTLTTDPHHQYLDHGVSPQSLLVS